MPRDVLAESPRYQDYMERVLRWEAVQIRKARTEAIPQSRRHRR